MRTCWARELGGCSGKISGEHAITAGFFTGKGMTLGGWDKPEKTVGVNSIEVHTLCATHNTALSPTDDCIIDLRARFQQIFGLLNGGTIRTEPLVFKRSGDLLERWFLKTALTNLIRDHQDMVWPSGRPVDSPPLHFVKSAFGQAVLQPPMGLYHVTIRKRKFHLEPVVGMLANVRAADSTIVSVCFDFYGLYFLLWLDPSQIDPEKDKQTIMMNTDRNAPKGTMHKEEGQTNVLYRPPLLAFNNATMRACIELEWSQPYLSR